MGSSGNRNRPKNFYPHPVTGKDNDVFVGFRIRGNEIHFHYPEAYRFDPDAPGVRKDVVALLRTVALASSAEDRSRGFRDSSGKGEFALHSYLWVINDYLINGFYVNREKRYQADRPGRISWKRTLQSQPIVSEGRVIYPHVVAEVRNEADNILVEIHRHCVKKSIDFVGWLFDLTSSFIREGPVTEAKKKQYVQVLCRELDRTYEDGKRVRLTHLLRVLQGLDIGEREEITYGTETYYHAFERMIDAIFGNVKDLRDFCPGANWRLVKNGFRETPGSHLRPDTILLREGSAFILDSKFYRFGVTGDERDLPAASSIQKQITYGEFLQKNAPGEQPEHIYNAFLLPCDRVNGPFPCEDAIQYAGFARSEWKDGREDHELIHAFLIDLRHVITVWNRSDHGEDVRFLCEEIVRRQKETAALLQEERVREKERAV